MKKIIVIGIMFLLGVTFVTPFSVFATDSGFGVAEAIEANGELNISGATGELATENALVEDIAGLTNWILGLGGLIALVFLLYGGFLMVTAGGSADRYGKGFSILRTAIIGLGIIGFAWFIVSIGFWLAQEVGNNASSAGTEN